MSLANVFHRARRSFEAAIVMHAAIDVSRDLNVNHFTLGNIYAVLLSYNDSVLCFENTLRLQPDFDAAAKRRHAVLCHAKLELEMEKQKMCVQLASYNPVTRTSALVLLLTDCARVLECSRTSWTDCVITS